MGKGQWEEEKDGRICRWKERRRESRRRKRGKMRGEWKTGRGKVEENMEAKDMEEGGRREDKGEKEWKIGGKGGKKMEMKGKKQRIGEGEERKKGGE